MKEGLIIADIGASFIGALLGGGVIVWWLSDWKKKKSSNLKAYFLFSWFSECLSHITGKTNTRKSVDKDEMSIYDLKGFENRFLELSNDAHGETLKVIKDDLIVILNHLGAKTDQLWPKPESDIEEKMYDEVKSKSKFVEVKKMKECSDRCLAKLEPKI